MFPAPMIPILKLCLHAVATPFDQRAAVNGGAAF
jgi:hypothetical protein